MRIAKTKALISFAVTEVEGFYYLCSKNKGADQLH